MRKHTSDILAVFFILAVSLFVLRSLFTPGLPMYHDSSPHIARMIAYKEALLDGQFPPVWAKNLLGGVGSPVLTVSYQLPYMFSELLTRIGLSIIDSYKFTLGFSLVFSGLLMYFALRQKFGIGVSLVSSLIYILAPYRMVDILVRGAIGEALAFVFIPVVLLGIFRKSFFWLTLGWVGLFLTHPLVSAIFAGFYLIYILFVIEKEDRKKLLGKFIFSFILALVISAFNLLPIATLTKFTHYSPEQSDPLGHFPTLFQLISSPWGYGASIAGPKDYMSFSVGFVQLAVILGLSIYLFDRWQLGKKISKEILFLTATLIANLLMLTSISAPVYRSLQLSRFIDFPWRLLILLVFLLSFISAILLTKLSGRIRNILLVILSLGLIIFSIPITKNHPNYWEEKLSFFEFDTGDDKGEYASIYRDTRQSLKINKKIDILEGSAEVEELTGRSNLREYRFDVKKHSLIRINVSYFPGWRLYLNDKPTDIKITDGINPKVGCFVTARSQIAEDDSGLIACYLPVGSQMIKLRYFPTPSQKAGNTLSLIGLSIFGIILASKKILKGRVKL